MSSANYNSMNSIDSLMGGYAGMKKSRSMGGDLAMKNSRSMGGDEFLFYDKNNVNDVNLYNITTGGAVFSNILESLNANMALMSGGKKAKLTQADCDKIYKVLNETTGRCNIRKPVKAVKPVKADKPKRPLTDYQKFMKSTLKDLKAKNINAKQSELMKMGAKMWRAHNKLKQS